eukprot:3180092-Prymnesium_polylepis.1
MPTPRRVRAQLSTPRPPGHAASAGSSRPHDLRATLCRSLLEPYISQSSQDRDHLWQHASRSKRRPSAPPSWPRSGKRWSPPSPPTARRSQRTSSRACPSRARARYARSRRIADHVSLLHLTPQ